MHLSLIDNLLVVMAQKRKKHNRFKQSLYLGSAYMKTFIKKNSKESFKCLKCTEDTFKKTGKDWMWCENLYPHLSSETHDENAPAKEKKQLEDLLDKINEKYSNKKIGKTNSKENDDEEDLDLNTQKYLEFISFLVSQRLSFSQISQIGKFLQCFAQEDHLEFFLTHYFDEEVILKTISQCFRPILKEDILKNHSIR